MSATFPHPALWSSKISRVAFNSSHGTCQFISMCQNPLDASDRKHSDRKHSSNWLQLKNHYIWWKSPESHGRNQGHIFVLGVPFLFVSHRCLLLGWLPSWEVFPVADKDGEQQLQARGLPTKKREMLRFWSLHQSLGMDSHTPLSLLTHWFIWGSCIFQV
jgi:hypothetical protein